MAPGICRLCGTADNLLYIFDSNRQRNMELMRYIIYLATGIKIKPTDEVSKMVCHRCCEVALKLHKYRNNAVANDKLLKERCGQRYSAPITDQQELFRITSKTVAQESNACDKSIIILDNNNSCDPLELLNLCIKEEVVDQPSSIASTIQHSHNETSTRSSVDTLFNHSTLDVIDGLLKDQHCHNRTEITKTATNITEETPISKSGTIATPSEVNITDGRPSVILSSSQNIKDSAVSTNSGKSVPKVKYKHQSVRELFKTFKGIMLPEKVFKSDVSPVISLDSAEVNDWYRKHLKQKLPSVVIKKVPNSSNYTISSSSITLHEPTIATSSKQDIPTGSDTSIVTSPQQSGKILYSIKRKLNPNYRPIFINDFDNGVKNAVNREKIFDFDHQKENDIPEVTPEASSADQHAAAASNNNVSLNNLANQRTTTLIKNIISNKNGRKNSGRRPRIKRKRTLLEDSDSTEIIPEKKKRVYCNKNALKTHNKMDLPQECPSDKNEQKAIFTSSLELRPVKPLSSKPACVEPSSLVELTPALPSLEPVGPPELVTRTTREIFLCPVCNNVYDTKKQLRDHESTHLMCKFCNNILESVELLKIHQNENCFAGIVNNKPFIKLRRVDDIPSIVKHYAQAFAEPNMSIQTESNGNLYCNEYIDYSELAPHIEEVVLPTPSHGLFIGLEETDQNFGLVQKREQNSQSATLENQKCDVVCIPDSDSDDEIECIEIPTHKIIENPYFDSAAKIEASSTKTNVDVASHKATSSSSELEKQLDKSTSISKFPPTSNLSEKEMICHLFKKYPYCSKKCEKNSQTFTFSNDNIEFPKSHLTTIYDMYTELFIYKKVPVSLEFGQKISTTFKEQASMIEHHPQTLECWTHKKTVFIQKPRAVLTKCAELSMPTNNPATGFNVFPKKINIPLRLLSLTNRNEFILIKKSTASEVFNSNVATTVSYVDNSCNSSSTLPVATCAISTDAIQQRPTVGMKSPNTDVLSVPTSGVSRSHISSCTSNITNTFNSAIATTASLTLPNNVNSVSPKVDTLACSVTNNSSVNSITQQQLWNLTQPRGTVIAQNNTSVAATEHQYHNINSITPVICTAANSTFSVPSAISATSANTLSAVASTSKITHTKYAYQHQQTQIAPPNSAAVPHQIGVIPQNHRPVALRSRRDCHVASTSVANPISVVPLTRPVGLTNNLCNVTPVPTMVACSNPCQTGFTNFMQIVEPQISAVLPHQAVVVTTANITSNNANVAPYTVPLASTNNIYAVTPTAPAQNQHRTNYINIAKSTNAAALSYQLTAVHNNITNMNQVNNNMQQLPLRMSNNIYETSFLCNADSNLSLLRKHANQITVGTGNQSNVVTTEAMAQLSGILRVKTVRELT